MVTLASPSPLANLGSAVLMRKVALVAPAGTTTLAGTFAAFAGSAASETSTSTAAGMLRVTEPSTGLPATTLLVFKTIDDSAGFSARPVAVMSKHDNPTKTIAFV